MKNASRYQTTPFRPIWFVIYAALVVSVVYGCAVPGQQRSSEGPSRGYARAAYSESEVQIVFREPSEHANAPEIVVPRTREEEVTHRAPAQDGSARIDRYEDQRSPDVRTLRRDPRRVTTARRGFSLPYPITRRNVISTFGDCRPGGRTHAGLDIAGIGEHSGLGTPVYSMARAEVTFVGLPQLDPAKFGEPDKRRGTTERGPHDEALPRALDIPVYGTVFFFTRNYGSWHSGVVISTKVLDGPLAGHTIRYMHLGMIHPELERGSIIEAGQELGLMGGTAVMTDSPHVHIDIETEDGARVDVAPFLGLPADPTRCRR